MRFIAKFLFALLLVSTNFNDVYSQDVLPDACSLATTSELSKLLGIELADTKSSVKGTYCNRQTADFARSVVVQYVDFHEVKTAQQLLGWGFDGNKKDIDAHKTAVGIYETLELFPEAGESANYMTGEAKNSVFPLQTRLQFRLGKYLVSVDTRGIPITKVTANTSAIFKMIKKNSGL